jgi:hypothetical protein
MWPFAREVEALRVCRSEAIAAKVRRRIGDDTTSGVKTFLRLAPRWFRPLSHGSGTNWAGAALSIGDGVGFLHRRRRRPRF